VLLKVAGKNIYVHRNYRPGSTDVRSGFYFQEDRLVYSAIHHRTAAVSDIDKTCDLILRDLSSSTIRVCDENELIVTFFSEGHDVQEARLLARAIEKIFSLQRLGFIFSVAVDDFPDYPYRCIPTSLSRFGSQSEWFDSSSTLHCGIRNINLDRKFLCLNRRPSAIRERLVFLLEKFLPESSMRVSLGTLSDRYQGPRIWVDDARWIDGVADESKQHDMITDARFQSCLFNIVSESSDQSDPANWNSRFITEKTWKAYSMYQIPIWMAVPGLVSCVRSLGFDMFDDICEHHDYDTIQDEHQRQDRLIDLISRIDQTYSISDLGQLRQTIWPRLEHNRRLLEKISSTRDQILVQALREIW
jgi:hypothetical protein